MNIYGLNNSLYDAWVSYVFLKILSISNFLGGCGYNHLTLTFPVNFVVGLGTQSSIVWVK